MPNRKKAGSHLGFYTMGIVALFLVGFFLLVIFGAGSYRNTVAGQTQNNETRALLSYLATTVRANDTTGAVTVAGTENEPILVVRDGMSGYAFRIYRHDGNLVEDYAAMDDDLHPEDAQVIGTTAVFTVKKDEKTLRVTTDAGSVLLALRSEGGDV